MDSHHVLTRIFLLLVLLGCIVNAIAVGVFNVNDYGAISNGKTDNTKAFSKTWTEACASEGESRILIPRGDYLVGPLLFKGPCKGPMVVQLDGQLLGDTNLNVYTGNWIDFQYISELTVTGKGKVNGQGKTAWPKNECPKKWTCKTLPMNMAFNFINGGTINGITSIDPKFFHMIIFGCKNIDIQKVTISAPENSPNTDGIHIGGSSNINIANCNIGTGDDCVSVGDSTNNLTVTNVNCGPGHGISVGSLGKRTNEGDVVGVHVKHCTLTKTMTGVRVKSWQNSPKSTVASDFTFEDIIMKDVGNPILIDQKYCPYAVCDSSAPSRVKINRIAFRNIRGTSTTPEAIKLVCSDLHPCEGIELSDINLSYSGSMPAANFTSICTNVRGVSSGNVKPPSCI